MPQLILLGAPGSGKGTQAKRLASEFSFKHLSTGDLLRDEIKKGSELGKRVDGILKAGKLVDDLTVLELLKKNCDLKKLSFIFDGFPRNIDQAKLLDEKVLEDNPYKVVYFDIDDQELIERLSNRVICKDCGSIYNALTTPPKREGICDLCKGTQLMKRDDDKAEVVKDRLKIYNAMITPVLDYYAKKGVLKKVSASKPSEKVFEQLKELVKGA